MAFYGVGIDTEVARLICEIKLKLANKFGGFGLRQLALAFRRADVQCQGFLHEEDFLEAINGIGIFVRQIDQQALIKYFTQPGCGVIYPAFVDRFRDPLSPQREAVVKQAFDSADINGTGFLEPVEVSKTLFTLQALYTSPTRTLILFLEESQRLRLSKTSLPCSTRTKTGKLATMNGKTIIWISPR